MRAAALITALAAGASAQTAVSEFISVPGGLACPRDCELLDSMALCEQGAQALGLPCGHDKTATGVKSGAMTGGTTDTRYTALLAHLGITLNGGVVSGLQNVPNIQTLQGYTLGLVGTELVQISSGGSDYPISNNTVTAQAEIKGAFDNVPSGAAFSVLFKDGCNVAVTSLSSAAQKATIGGCSWSKQDGLIWNSYNDGGQRDALPWTQRVDEKRSVPGKGADHFRICKCSVMPPFVAVMHAKCAPSCSRSYDVCTQHPGCKRITSWDTCRAAAHDMQWLHAKGGNAGPVGSMADTFAEWNAQFATAKFVENRGAPVGNPAAPLCVGAGLPCARNPMWAEWANGLPGGADRYCNFQNDTAADVADWFNSNRWLNNLTGTLNVLAPPPLNFLGDKDARFIPGSPWNAFWQAPATFLSGTPFVAAGSWRPQGCSYDAADDFAAGFYPWSALRLRSDQEQLTQSACCPPGTFGVSCFVENCTAQPCLSTGVGEECSSTQLSNEMFTLCECSNDVSSSNDECQYYGQPCGVGQTCNDPQAGTPINPNAKRFECSCGSDTQVAAPVSPCAVPNLVYITKPAGRDCGSCSRVVDENQCSAAAAQLGLADTLATEDPIGHRRVRPCGCHYSEHDGMCSGASGGCLRFNPTYGNGVHDGCDAYEPADAHDFMICACESQDVPDYVATPKGQCMPSLNCQTIVSKQDCRKAAESIGMHLAVHEEQEALLLLNQQGGSKVQFNTYLGADGNTYLHNDDGLGPVVGDGPATQATRPPGCHYRRRFDADVLPDGATVNWPHLLFNPVTTSAVDATTSDWLLCDCSSNPQAPTPAPTSNHADYAALKGFSEVGSGGQCAYVGGDISGDMFTPFRATFQTCVDLCEAATACRAVQWCSDPDGTVDQEGYGNCSHIKHCAVADRPCTAMTVVADNRYRCFEGPALTPAPTPAPTFPEGHLGGACRSFCCMQMNREDCCGTSCDLGTNGSYCYWNGKNHCERNCYPREGPCAEIELCFNFTQQVDFDNLSTQVAKEVNLLLGADSGAVVPLSNTYDAAAQLLTIVLQCPDGGCGSKQYIVDSICFSGANVAAAGGDKVKKAVNGKCLNPPGGVLTADAPQHDLAGLQPIRVTASSCQCVPVLENTTTVWNNTTSQWVQMPLAWTADTVNAAADMTPAWTDTPPVNTLGCWPSIFNGLTQFKTHYRVPFGTQFTLKCPIDCGVCDLYIVHYHDPPCSSDVNGRWPALLTDQGWEAGSCAPCMKDDTDTWKMVTYRRQIEGGTSVTTPAVETSCLAYFSIFAGPGVNCESNDLQDEKLCGKAGGLCHWRDGQCVTEWCRPRPPLPPAPRPPGDQKPGSPSIVGTCVPAPGAECVGELTRDRMDEALGQLP